LRRSVAERITEAVSSPVRVRIAQDENRDLYVAMLAEALRHAGVNHNQVAKKIAGLVAPSELVDFVRRDDAAGLQKHAVLNDSQAEKVIRELSDLEVLLRIETVDLVDQSPRVPEGLVRQDQPFNPVGSTAMVGESRRAISRVSLADKASKLAMESTQSSRTADAMPVSRAISDVS